MKFEFKDVFDEEEKKLHIINMKELEIKPYEITALVGCNGSGKTISILQMKDQLIRNGFDDISFYISFNPFAVLNKNKKPATGYFVHFSKNADFIQSGKRDMCTEFDLRHMYRNTMLSTGEGIIDRTNEFIRATQAAAERAQKEKVPLVIFLDDFDTGVSIDMMLEMRKLLNSYFSWGKEHNVESYAIIASNSYDLIRGYRCIYPYNGQEYTFNSYEDFKNFVLFSREIKNKR